MEELVLVDIYYIVEYIAVARVSQTEILLETTPSECNLSTRPIAVEMLVSTLCVSKHDVDDVSNYS